MRPDYGPDGHSSEQSVEDIYRKKRFDQLIMNIKDLEFLEKEASRAWKLRSEWV